MGSPEAENTEVVVEGSPRVSAWDRLFLFMGAAFTTAGVAIHGSMLADGPHPFALKLSGIAMEALGAGCIAVAPSVRGGLKT